MMKTIYIERVIVMNVKINKEELISFLEYLEDKVEDCYKKEIKQSIERFLKRIEKENSR